MEIQDPKANPGYEFFFFFFGDEKYACFLLF